MGFVLMPVESKAIAAVNEILDGIRVHIVNLQWRAFNVVVPDRKTQASFI